MTKHAAEKDQAMDEEENCSDEDEEEAVEAEEEEEEEQEFVKVDPFDDPINGPNYEQSEEEEGSSRENSQDSPFEEEDALSNIPQRFWPVPVEEAISTDLNRSQSSFDRWSSPQKKRPKTEEEHEEGEYIRGTSAPCGSSWFSRILPCIRSSVCMLSPKSLLLQKPTHLELREVRKITLTLLTHVEDAIDNERDTEMESQRGELEAKQKDMAKKRQEAEGKLADELAEHWRTKKKLEKQQRDGDAEAERQRALLRQTVGEVSRQRAMLERKLEDLKQRHKRETEARKAEHEGKLEEMKRKLEMEMETKQKQMQMQEMEKQKYCCACKQKPREAVVIPCLHMDYCFKCLLKSRAIRNNMCPKCNRPIKGICMSAHAGTAATAAASHG